MFDDLYYLGLPGASQAHLLHEWSVENLLCAVRIWFRQLRLHHGLLCAYWRLGVWNQSPAAHSLHGPASRRSSCGFTSVRPSLSPQDRIKQQILSWSKFGGLISSADLRKALKNKVGAFASHKIIDAVNDLLRMEVIELVQDSGQPARGHAVIKFVKKSWADLHLNQTAMHMLERIGIGHQYFP